MSESGTDWSEAQIAQLRTLWAEKATVVDIARRMGRTKSAITGKVHRLGLSARPSPIRRDDGHARVESMSSDGEPDLAPEVRSGHWPLRGPTLPPLASAASEDLPSPADQLGHVVMPRIRQCTWVDGNRGAYVFCDLEAAAGKSWCPAHCARVFVRAVAAEAAP